MLWMRKDSSETSRLANLDYWTIFEPQSIYRDVEDLRNAPVTNGYLASCSAKNAPQQINACALGGSGINIPP